MVSNFHFSAHSIDGRGRRHYVFGLSVRLCVRSRTDAPSDLLVVYKLDADWNLKILPARWNWHVVINKLSVAHRGHDWSVYGQFLASVGWAMSHDESRRWSSVEDWPSQMELLDKPSDSSAPVRCSNLISSILNSLVMRRSRENCRFYSILLSTRRVFAITQRILIRLFIHHERDETKKKH